MKKHLLLLLILIVNVSAFSQRQKMGPRRIEYADSCHHIVIIGVNIGGDMPFGDFKTRFGVEGNYIFSNGVKENPLDFMYNASNTITGSSGNPGAVRLNERGFTAYAV